MAGRKVVVTGIAKIDRKLHALDLKVQKSITRTAIRTALKAIMVPEVKDQVPIDTGLTRESVKVRAVKARKRGVIALDVRIAASTAGLKKTSTTTGDTVFYPAVVEYGRAGVPPDPFMRRAFQAAGKSARNAALDEIRSGIEKEARRR